MQDNRKCWINMTSEEAKGLVKNRVDSEIESVHSMIEGYARLGGKAICLDQNVAHIHLRTIRVLEEEGFDISYSNKENENVVFISWY